MSYMLISLILYETSSTAVDSVLKKYLLKTTSLGS